MWLTKNEKTVLKLLIDDAKLSDIFIANKLKISSQAVGRIRKRLEKDIIKGYTINLNSKILGINIVACLKVSLNTYIKDFDVDKLETRLKNIPEITMILKNLSGTYDYILFTAFSDMDDLEQFITEKKKEGTFDSFCTIKELIALPNTCILKKSEKGLLTNLIDNKKTKKVDFSLE